jgi:hypothetical protein
MDDGTAYDVRVYRTDVYKGAKVTTYRVRWKAGHRLWQEGFRNAALADSFRSSLLTAARKGEAFSLITGRPVSWQRNKSARTWYDLTLDYAAAKWPHAAPNHRKSIAEALTDATEAMLATDEPPYPVEEIRRALRTWAFSDRLRGATAPPEDLAAVVRWLQTATLPVADLSRPGTGATRCRTLLNRISGKQDGTAAAANTANRKRAVLNNLMQYAVETGACLPTRSRPLSGPVRAHSRPWTRAPSSTVTRRGACSPPSASRANAGSGWSPSSAACTTPRCALRKPSSCALRTSPASPTTAGAS